MKEFLTKATELSLPRDIENPLYSGLPKYGMCPFFDIPWLWLIELAFPLLIVFHVGTRCHRPGASGTGLHAWNEREEGPRGGNSGAVYSGGGGTTGDYTCGRLRVWPGLSLAGAGLRYGPKSGGH